MVNAINVATAGKVAGIATTLIAPGAFNTPVDKALEAGIPVIAYNADEDREPPSLATSARATRLLGLRSLPRVSSAAVPKGSLVGMVIATPGSGNIQPRIDGATPIFKAAGLETATIAGGALQAQETTAVESWYQGHKDVKFFYAVDSGDGIAVAQCISKNKLHGKVGGSAWDVGTPVLQGVQAGNLIFTIDQQAYLQGFVSTIQLFLYQISAGLMKPCDTDTGLGFVTSANVGPYLTHATRFEGASVTETAYTPPATIAV